ncbi:MAG: hypothetical protein SX243_11430 [Acidobacteriota bacterium]|nr:hypothetical protein [Acidobacteriota bacterium]
MNLHPLPNLRIHRALGLVLPSLLTLAALPAGATTPAATAVSYQARAYCLETGAELYSEHHRERWRGDRLVGASVEYRKPGGEVFATKHLSYEAGVITPSFEMEDHRSGYREGAEVDGGEVLLFAQKPAKTVAEKERVELPATAVIDAGFAYFVTRHWDRLAAGETVPLDFAVPARQRFVAFRALKTDGGAYQDRPALRVRMEPGNPVFRLLVDPIDLIFDRETRRLLVFEGLSNIEDDDGDSLDVRIVFDYSRAAPPDLATALGR